MFARKVSIRLKPNSVFQFVDHLENQIMPILRRQKGFLDEISFVTPSGSQAFTVTFWDRQENADVYARDGYLEVAKILGTVTEGPGQVEIFDVISSTVHKIAGGAAIAGPTLVLAR
jgi:hypothetical protein